MFQTLTATLTATLSLTVTRTQGSNQRLWDLDAAALRLVAALLRNNPACRVIVRGSGSPAAAADSAAAGGASRLSLRGSGRGDDGALRAEQLALFTGDSGRPGSGRASRHAPLSPQVCRWILLMRTTAACCHSTVTAERFGSEWT